MEKGTRFRVINLTGSDRLRGVSIGDTGTVKEPGTEFPWCRMDKPGANRATHKPFGIPDGYAAVLHTSQLSTAPKPRKAPKLQETSLKAHASQKDKAPSDCATILARIRKYRTGTTCDKLEQVLGMSHQTTSARINDLVRKGRIRDSGHREKTRTGRLAICWKVVA